MSNIMTMEQVQERLKHIRSLADDPSEAHFEEKRLWRDVLMHTAAGGQDAHLLAAAALEAMKIDFDRWFS
jgi:hypothetical protein